MAVQWTVARAVAIGLVKERVPFLRTAKGGATCKGPDFPAFWEAVIAALLLIGALTLVITNYKQVHEINIFAWVLVVQSLPFLAAVALAADRGHPLQQLRLLAQYRSQDRCQGCRSAAAAAGCDDPSDRSGHRRAAERHRGTGAVRVVRRPALGSRRSDSDYPASAVSASRTQ